MNAINHVITFAADGTARARRAANTACNFGPLVGLAGLQRTI